MANIYTAYAYADAAGNYNSFIKLAVVAEGHQQAVAALEQSLSGFADEYSGDYEIFDNAVVILLPDEDGDYIEGAGDFAALVDAATVRSLFANPGVVVMLDSGACG